LLLWLLLSLAGKAAPAATPAAADKEAPCHHQHHHQHHHHHAGHRHSFAGLFDMPRFTPFFADAARDVFGVEQAVTTRMHDVFEDILSGPAFPSVFDIIEDRAAEAAAAAKARGAAILKQLPTGVLLSQQVGSKPGYDVVITTSSSKHSSSGGSGKDGAASGTPSKPTWEQQVIISSSDPERLKELSDLFSAQLRSTGAAAAPGSSRKLLGASSSVELADTAEVVLLAAKKMRAAQALPTATH
jgi:hypothetical protein